MQRRSVKRSACAIGLSALAALAACSSTPKDDEQPGDLIDAYGPVIQWFVDNTPPDNEKVLVFIEAGGEGWEIELETQVELISVTEDFATLRFIDHRSEALEDDGVRDGGILLALRPAVSEGSSAVIECDQVLGGEVLLSWSFELKFENDGWRLNGVPTPVG